MSIKQWFIQRAKRNLDGVPVPAEIPTLPIVEESVPKSPQPGAVWVEGNGHIHVKDPDPGEPYAVIYMDPGRSDIELIVNGKPRVGSIVVQASDHIVARPQSPASRSRVTVDVDGPGMVATLTATFERGVVRQLKDSAPASFLEIASYDFLRAPVPILMEHVLAEMDHKQIRYGRVSPTLIEDFLQQRQSGSIPIAYGSAAEPAVADTYLPVPRRATENYPGTEISHPDLVSAGTVVATRVTGNPSRVGMTVFATPIAPPHSAMPSLHMGPGIVPMNKGQHLVAHVPGRVIWDDKGVRLRPLKVIDHSLSRDNEILHEDGDLLVEGSLTHTVLTVEGNVIITKDVSHSRILAGGSIFVEGTTDYATLECGVADPFAIELRRKISEIGDAVETLTQMMEQVRLEAPDAYRHQFSNVLEKLFRQKCSFVPATVLWLSQRKGIDESPPRALSGVGVLIEKILQGFEPQAWQEMQDMNALENLHTAIEEWLSREAPVTPLTDASQTAFLHNTYRSLIRSHGAIVVRDAVTSDMEAGTQIQARTLVGGFYQAHQAITAQFIGSEDRTETSIQVFTASGKVTADILFPNTVVQIGQQRHRVNRVTKNAVVDSL